MLAAMRPIVFKTDFMCVYDALSTGGTAKLNERISYSEHHGARLWQMLWYASLVLSCHGRPLLSRLFVTFMHVAAELSQCNVGLNGGFLCALVDCGAYFEIEMEMN